MQPKKRFFSLLRREKGATGVEYAILVAAIACAATWGVAALGKTVNNNLAVAGNQLQGQGQPAAAPAPVAAAPASPAVASPGGNGSGAPANAGGNPRAARPGGAGGAGDAQRRASRQTPHR